MREKGYKKPVDVWFDNINVLVDLKMDPEMKWANELMENLSYRDINQSYGYCTQVDAFRDMCGSPRSVYLLGKLRKQHPSYFKFFY
jgi:hypothetical protein